MEEGERSLRISQAAISSFVLACCRGERDSFWEMCLPGSSYLSMKTGNRGENVIRICLPAPLQAVLMHSLYIYLQKVTLVRAGNSCISNVIARTVIT